MRINHFLLAATMLVATIASCKGHTENPTPSAHEYKYSYAIRCNLFSLTRADATGDDALTHTWSADDSIYVIDPLTGKEAGAMQFQSGEGQTSALFLFLTDFEPGRKVSLRLWNNYSTLPAVQQCSAGASHPDDAYAYTEDFVLDPRINECTFTNPLAYIRLRLGTFEGSGLYGAVPESVSVITDRTYTAETSGYSGLTDNAADAWIAVTPASLHGKDISVNLTAKGQTGSLYATGTLTGRDIEAGHIYTINMTAAGGGVRPADNNKAEYSYIKVEYKKNMETATYGSVSSTTVDGMNRMPKLLVNTLDRFGGYAGVKPDAIMSSNPEGYWRTGKYKGRWVMVNPDGNVTILHGVNGVTPMHGKEEANSKTIGLYEEKFGSVREWSEYANRLLVDYGFNFYSANPKRIRLLRSFIPKSDQAVMRHHEGDARLGEVEIVYLLRTFLWDYYSISKTSVNVNSTDNGGCVFTLMFDPDYLDFIDKLAADAAALFKDDKDFIGYYLDNELEFRLAKASGPGIYLKQWLTLNTEKGCARAFPYAKAYAERFMRERFGVEPLPENVTAEMDNAFLLDISEYYYRTATEAMRRHDPNHLMLGTRLHGMPKTLRQVHEACAKYNDVVSVNVYGTWEPNDSYFIKQYKDWIGEYDKPCFITEFYTRDAEAAFDGEKYGNTGEGGGWIVKGQDSRGIHYQNFTRKAISYDHCIGWQWFQMTDVYMENYGWNNKGMVNPRFEPYYPLMDKMRELHWNIYQIMDWYFDRDAMIQSLPDNTTCAYWEY